MVTQNDEPLIFNENSEEKGNSFFEGCWFNFIGFTILGPFLAGFYIFNEIEKKLKGDEK